MQCALLSPTTAVIAPQQPEGPPVLGDGRDIFFLRHCRGPQPERTHAWATHHGVHPSCRMLNPWAAVSPFRQRGYITIVLNRQTKSSAVKKMDLRQRRDGRLSVSLLLDPAERTRGQGGRWRYGLSFWLTWCRMVGSGYGFRCRLMSHLHLQSCHCVAPARTPETLTECWECEWAHGQRRPARTRDRLRL